MMKNKGFTLVELVACVTLVAFVGFLAFGLFGSVLGGSSSQENSPVKLVKQSKYKSLTTESGLVPIKVVITNTKGATVYSRPSPSSSRSSNLEFFEHYYVFEQTAGFYRVGKNPYQAETLGYVKKSDALLWSTREALKLTPSSSGKTYYFWKNENEVGQIDKAHFMLDPDYIKPLPILESVSGRYKVAVDFQSDDYSVDGAVVAWTSALSIPGDGVVLCQATKQELGRRIEGLQVAIRNLQTRPSSDDPIIKMYQEVLGITFGPEIDAEIDQPHILKLIAGEAPEVPKIFSKNPSELRSDTERMKRSLGRMVSFYQESQNWDEQSRSWVPIDFIPGG